MTTLAEDRVKLEADGFVDLFRIELATGGTLFLKANDTKEWQGETWEGTAIELQGYANSSDEEMSRPKLAIANPEGIFSAFVLSGAIEKSIVKQIRVLREHFDADMNISEQRSWYIAQVTSVNKTMVSFELRNPIDGPNFLTPARMYLPPEYPAVSLT